MNWFWMKFKRVHRLTQTYGDGKMEDGKKNVNKL